MSKNWSHLTTNDEAARRAAGRRRYNAVRQFRAQHRRAEVQRLLLTLGWEHGVQTRIAQQLGVAESTISRDLQAIFGARLRCPTCDATHSAERWASIERRQRATA